MDSMQVYVKDMIMGSGKSSEIIELVKSNRDDFYFCVLPYLSEVERYISNCNPYLPAENKLIDPQDIDGSKSEHLLEILKYKKGSVCTTHSMLERLNVDHLHYIRSRCAKKGKKVLVLDETVDLVKPLNDSRLPYNTLMADIENEYIEVNETTGAVGWNILKDFQDGSYPHHKYLRDLCETGMLYFLDNRYLVVEVPSDFMYCFDEVIVLTYRWQHSIMANYCDVNNLNPTMLPVDDDRIMEVYRYIAKHLVIDDEITVENLSKNAMTNNDLKIIKSQFNEAIKKAMEKYDTNMEHTLFTTFRSVDGENLVDWLKTIKVGKWQYMDHNGRVEPRIFLSHTTLGTNEYSHCNLMIYGLSKFLQPGVHSWFSSKGHSISGEGWALSAMLQWLFRGCIRDHNRGEKMYAVILCPRMREMAKDWLAGVKRQVISGVIDKPGKVLKMTSKERMQKKQQFEKWKKNNPSGRCFSFEDYVEHGGVELKRQLKEVLEKYEDLKAAAKEKREQKE